MATGSSTARWGRAAFLLVFVAVMGSAAWWQYDRQRVRADHSAAVARASAQVLAAVVGTENAARDYIVTRDTSLLAAYDAGRLQLVQAVRVAGVAVHGDAVLRTRLAEERTLIDGWESAVAADVAATGPDATANAAARAAARDRDARPDPRRRRRGGACARPAEPRGQRSGRGPRHRTARRGVRHVSRC